MVNIELIIFVLLILSSFGLIYKYREKVKIETLLGIPLKKPIKILGKYYKKFPLIYTVLVRTKVGLNTTDKIVNKSKKSFRVLGYICIIIGILSGVLMGYFLIDALITKLTTPSAITQAVAFVLPIKAKGVFYVPLVYWMLSIFIIVVIHEFGHALIARAHNIKIKSTGPAFFSVLVPIIPAAFVEPDEKELKARTKREKLSVYAAGASFNILTGLMMLVLGIILVMTTHSLFVGDGVKIELISSDKLKATGLQEGQIIRGMIINGEEYIIKTVNDLDQLLGKNGPGTDVTILTKDGKIYNHKLEKHSTDLNRGALGISLSQYESIKGDTNYNILFIKFIQWTKGLLGWLFLLSIGIGLFNLLPMVPLDGGAMVSSLVYNTKIEKPITYGISALFLVVLILSFVV